jgi:hypothetical protein
MVPFAEPVVVDEVRRPWHESPGRAAVRPPRLCPTVALGTVLSHP